MKVVNDVQAQEYLPATLGALPMRDVFNDSQELYLDPVHKKLGGVCAGVGNYLDVERLYVRIAAVISLCIFPQATLLAYGLAYLILDEPPDDYDGVERDPFDD